MNKKLLSMTLMELIITIGIVAILAGATIANLSKLKSPQDRIDEATDMIVNYLNQANSQSLATNYPVKVCKLLAATSSTNLATCDTTAAGTTWSNVNGITFPRITITITGTNGVITYTNGLVAQVFVIQVTSNDKSGCYNTITLWPNSVINVSRALASNC